MQTTVSSNGLMKVVEMMLVWRNLYEKLLYLCKVMNLGPLKTNCNINESINGYSAILNRRCTGFTVKLARCVVSKKRRNDLQPPRTT